MPNLSNMQIVEILRAACCIAGIDQEIAAEELAQLQKIATHAGVGTMSLNAMLDRAKDDSAFFEEQFEILKTDPDMTMRALFAVACADRELTVDERVVLYYFAQKLEMPDKQFNHLLAVAQRKINQSSD